METGEKAQKTVEEVLMKIKNSYGMELLEDESNLAACFLDLAPHLQRESRLLRCFVETG